jgi:transcriptional regulator with XRE-family HTH domain
MMTEIDWNRSKLADLINPLKGDRTTADIVEGAGVSRETLRRIDLGQCVKLSTLHDIARFLGADETRWAQMVVAWMELEIELELGPEMRRRLKFGYEPEQPRNEDDDEIREGTALLRQLSKSDRGQFLQVMRRAEALPVIAALNATCDSLVSK